MDLDYREIFQVFQVEADESFAAMEQALVAFERHPDDDDGLNTLFRIAHTLKGNSNSLGIRPMTALAHAVENVLHGFRNRTLTVTRARVDVLFHFIDAMRVLLVAAAAGPLDTDPPADLLQQLDEAALPDRDVALGAPAPQPIDQVLEAAPATESRTQRVDVSKLDRLLDLAAEIAGDRSRLREALSGGSGSARHLATLDESEHLYGELQDLVMRARLVPLRPMLAHFTRLARDLAGTTGKPARLQILERGVEVDMVVVEKLRDPLTHMLRNAFDHGVEPPAERRRLGKDPVATLTLIARHDAAGVVLQLRDDGAGLDRARILTRAVAQGLTADPEGLSDKAVFDFIFAPGFSTAAAVTELSGRGVGMDVVRRHVEALRGTVDIDSIPGHGATLTIRLPLTLAMVNALAVDVAGQVYMIPMESIEECVDLPGDGSQALRAGAVEHDGRLLPLVPLAALFGRPSSRTSPRVVVVRHEDAPSGLVVDRIVGSQSIVVRPLPRRGRGLPVFAGSVVLGSGRVALLVDVNALLRHASAVARA